jgi:hypothetical protein
MEEMAKIEAKGDASQEELEALAADLSSKVCIAADMSFKAYAHRNHYP